MKTGKERSEPKDFCPTEKGRKSGDFLGETYIKKSKTDGEARRQMRVSASSGEEEGGRRVLSTTKQGKKRRSAERKKKVFPEGRFAVPEVLEEFGTCRSKGEGAHVQRARDEKASFSSFIGLVLQSEKETRLRDQKGWVGKGRESSL